MNQPVLSKKTLLAIALAAGVGYQAGAYAEITVGATLTVTGPASALGVPMRQGLEIWPSEIAGEKINLTILDDGGDPSASTRNARKFVTEGNVDLLLGSNTTPTGMAVSSVAQEARIPHFAFAPIPLQADKSRYTFVIPQSVGLMAQAVVKDMKSRGLKRIGFIGFSDPWGEQWLAALTKGFAGSDIKIVADEKYGRADTSVTGQVLKLISARPDAVFIAGSGTGAALPQERWPSAATRAGLSIPRCRLGAVPQGGRQVGRGCGAADRAGAAAQATPRQPSVQEGGR
ncbi:MAG: ABC transporter substrate-binding protein [Burkholderiaceae bacterium]